MVFSATLPLLVALGFEFNGRTHVLKKILCVWLPAVSALTVAACSSSCKNPAAQQPSGLNVMAILQPGGCWTNFGANPAGQF